MEDELDESWRDEFFRQYERIAQHGSSTAERIRVYAAMRIAANERLVLLASGMLTLTFSGVFGLVSHQPSLIDQTGMSRLLWAWKLLVVSIIMCIVANSREAAAASLYDTDLLATELNARAVIFKAVGQKLNPKTPHEPKLVKHGDPKVVRQSELIAYWTGFAARVCIVAAFALLYRFAREMLVHY